MDQIQLDCRLQIISAEAFLGLESQFFHQCRAGVTCILSCVLSSSVIHQLGQKSIINIASLFYNRYQENQGFRVGGNHKGFCRL